MLFAMAMKTGGGGEGSRKRNQITSMQCSWVKGLFEDDFHDW